MKKEKSKLVLTASFILAIKSRGSAEPLACLEGARGIVFGFDAEKIWSRNRYRAASTTPIERIKTSEEEAAISGGAGEKVV